MLGPWPFATPERVQIGRGTRGVVVNRDNVMNRGVVMNRDNVMSLPTI